MRKTFLSIVACFVLCASFAQKNTVFAEAGGNGLFGSLNYERQLTKSPLLLARAGIGIYNENGAYLTVPVGFNYLINLKNNTYFLDAGVGASWAHDRKKPRGTSKTRYVDNFWNFIPSIGYRAHKEKGLMWRISLTPIINRNAFTPWVGFSLGKRF